MGVFHAVILTLPLWCGAAFLSIALFVPTGTMAATREAQMDIPDGVLLGLFVLGMVTIFLLLRKK